MNWPLYITNILLLCGTIVEEYTIGVPKILFVCFRETDDVALLLVLLLVGSQCLLIELGELINNYHRIRSRTKNNAF